MPRLWKILIVVSLSFNGICLLYVYLLLHPNPYGTQHYANEQTKVELRLLKDELNETKIELGKIKMAVQNLYADIVPSK